MPFDPQLSHGSPGVVHVAEAPREPAFEPLYLLRWLARNLRFILLPALAAALLAGLWVVLWEPVAYRASSTLLLIPSPDTAGPSLPASSFLQVASSRTLLDELRSQLVDEGLLAAGHPLRMGRELERRLDASDRARPRQTADSLLVLTASLESPDAAARAANLWAERVMTHVGDRLAALVQGDLEERRARLQEAQQRLADLRQRRAESESRFAAEELRLTERLEAGVREQRLRGLALEADHRRETARLLSEQACEGDSARREQSLTALKDTYAQLYREHTEIAPRLQQEHQEMEVLEHRLAETPARLTLRHLLGGDDPLLLDGGNQSGTTVLSEEPNPTYLDLAQERGRRELLIASLENRLAHVAEDLERVGGQLQAMEEQVLDDQLQGDLLTAARDVAFQQLEWRLDDELQHLQRLKFQEIEGLDRRRAVELAKLDGELSVEERGVEVQAEALIAAQTSSVSRSAGGEGRLLVEALAPSAPRPHYLAFKMLAALLAGALAGLGWLLARALVVSGESDAQPA